MSTLTVRDVMEPDPLVVFPETEIVEAARLMREWAARELVVVSGTRPVGILTCRDVLARYVAEARDARLVGSIMTPDPRTVAHEERVDQAALLMIEHGIGRLPVCRENDLVGLVRRGDLARLAGWDELVCLLSWLVPDRSPVPAHLPSTLEELDASLEHVRQARTQFREAERALRAWRHGLATVEQSRSVGAHASASPGDETRGRRLEKRHGPGAGAPGACDLPERDPPSVA